MKNLPKLTLPVVLLMGALLIGPVAVAAQTTPSQQAQLQALIKQLQEQLTQAKSGENTVRTAMATVQGLADFPSAGVTWKSKFAKNGDVPAQGFNAYYFDTTKPSTVLKQEMVSSIDVNYAWNEGPGFTLRSEDFGGYWIGKFDVPATQEMVLTLSQSWSETRVIIDGKLVYKGGDNATVNFTVPKGSHTMEVEYVNNWHTTGFSAGLKSKDSVPQAIQGKLSVGSKVKDVWYVGVYESSAFDKSIKLSASKGTSGSKILILSSYDAVKWDLSALKGLSIETIVLSSYSPGSTVLNAPPGTKVVTGSVDYAYETKAQCYDTDSVRFYCDGLYAFQQAHNSVKALTGRSITGFVGSYEASSLVLPGEVLTDKTVKELLRYPGEVEAKARKTQKAQTIDNIF